MKSKSTKGSNFICLKCGGMGIPIQRRRSREKGHVKDLYCIHCGETTKQMELREDSGDTYEYNENPEEYIQKYTKGKIKES